MNAESNTQEIILLLRLSDEIAKSDCPFKKEFSDFMGESEPLLRHRSFHPALEVNGEKKTSGTADFLKEFEQIVWDLIESLRDRAEKDGVGILFGYLAASARERALEKGGVIKMSASDTQEYSSALPEPYSSILSKALLASSSIRCHLKDKDYDYFSSEMPRLFCEVSALTEWKINPTDIVRSALSKIEILTDSAGIAGWDISRVADMSSIFKGSPFKASLFNSNADIWGVVKDQGEEGVIQSCSAITDSEEGLVDPSPAKSPGILAKMQEIKTTIVEKISLKDWRETRKNKPVPPMPPAPPPPRKGPLKK